MRVTTVLVLLLVLAALAVGDSKKDKARKQPAKPEYHAFVDPQTTPAITQPKFVPAAQGEKDMQPAEPVIGVSVGPEARAYPVWLLERHFVVNDEIAGRPIAVTWDPFAHTGIVYRRDVAGKQLTFEADGRLLNDTLVLKDRETGSTWTQQDGVATEGTLARTRLSATPALYATWKAWKGEQPGTVVLDKTGEKAASSAYAAYEAESFKYGLGNTPMQEPRMGGKELIIGIVSGDERVAVPLSRLQQEQVLNISIDQQAMAALFDPSTGTARVVRAEARGDKVTLRRGPLADLFGRPTPPYLLDEETTSRWDLTGKAISGRMEGHRLPLMPYRLEYWYAWQAFFPKSRVE